MIFILSILIINLWLVSLVYRLEKKRHPKQVLQIKHEHHHKDLSGKLDKMYISSKIAEKMADRAFNMASSANLGVIALQKALAVPRLATKAQAQQNQLASKEVDKLFNTQGGFDWLRPLLSDEENELLDEAEKLKNKDMNGTTE